MSSTRRLSLLVEVIKYHAPLHFSTVLIVSNTSQSSLLRLVVTLSSVWLLWITNPISISLSLFGPDPWHLLRTLILHITCLAKSCYKFHKLINRFIYQVSCHQWFQGCYGSFLISTIIDPPIGYFIPREPVYISSTLVCCAQSSLEWLIDNLRRLFANNFHRVGAW